MKQPIVFFGSLLVSIALAPLGQAADYWASSDGSGDCSESSPCSASSAIDKASGGDTVYLKSGTYGSMFIQKGGSEGSWLTIAAAPGELPIIDSGGVNVQSSWVRFDGLVSRNASTGFGNKWTGGGTTNSNGNLQFVNCIADKNSANGIAFRSAKGVLISQCIAAHNGSSTSQSWSSGIDLFGAQGSYTDNIIERTISFENVDMQVHSDGSGFIVDDIGTGATFVNNIGFRNGGSCIRLTTSTNTHMINNSCYNDGLDQEAKNPNTPGEIFFSSAVTQEGAVMLNNLAVAHGWDGKQFPFNNYGSMEIEPHNFGIEGKDTPNPYMDPEGENPDYRLKEGSTDVIDKGTTTEAPSTDIGFDPKCIKKGNPGLQSWWIYEIDYAYIEQKGGVAKCFNPGQRDSKPDIGAYEYNASTATGGGPGTGGAPPETGGAASDTGGTSAQGGSPATGGEPTLATGGTPGSAAAGGATGGTPEETPAVGGTPPQAGAGGISTGGIGPGYPPPSGGDVGAAASSDPGDAASGNEAGATGSSDVDISDNPAGCACALLGVNGSPGRSAALALLAVLGLVGRRRRA